MPERDFGLLPPIRAVAPCLGPGLIDEQQPMRISPVLVGLSPRTLAGDVWAILLAGQHVFFEAQPFPVQGTNQTDWI